MRGESPHPLEQLTKLTIGRELHAEAIGRERLDSARFRRFLRSRRFRLNGLAKRGFVVYSFGRLPVALRRGLGLRGRWWCGLTLNAGSGQATDRVRNVWLRELRARSTSTCRALLRVHSSK